MLLDVVRWLAAGVQTGAIHLWRVHNSYPTTTTPTTPTGDQSVTNSPLMSTYETVDLSTPRNRDEQQSQQQQSKQQQQQQQSKQQSRDCESSPVGDNRCSELDDQSRHPHDPNCIFNDHPDVTLTGHTATIVVCRWDFSPLPVRSESVPNL